MLFRSSEINSGTVPIAQIPTGTTSSTVPLGGVITAGGPTGNATSIPVITYNAAGQLTAVTTATPSVTVVNGLSPTGAGAAIPTGPATSTNLDCVQFTGTSGQIADSGGPCGGGSSSFPLTVSGTVNSGGIPYFNSTTQESSSAAGTVNTLMKWGGAGTAPTSSAVTESSSTLAVAEQETVTSTAIGNVPLTVNGFSSGQTANLQNWYNYSGGTLEADISNTGNLYAQTVNTNTISSGTLTGNLVISFNHNIATSPMVDINHSQVNGFPSSSTQIGVAFSTGQTGYWNASSSAGQLISVSNQPLMGASGGQAYNGTNPAIIYYSNPTFDFLTTSTGYYCEICSLPIETIALTNTGTVNYFIRHAQAGGSLAAPNFAVNEAGEESATDWNPTTIYSAAGTALPTCASGIKGRQAVVSDATTPLYMTAYTSGGGITAAVICSYNGTTYSWLTH